MSTKLTRAIMLYLNTRGAMPQRVNTTGVFDIQRAADALHRAGAFSSAKAAGEFLRKFYRKSHERKGTADILGCAKDGRFIAVEEKRGRDVLSPAQIHYLSEVRRRGGIAVVARDFEQFKKDFDEYSKNTK